MADATQKVGARSRGVETPRRRWSEAQRRRIVAESYRSVDSVSMVAQRHGVYSSVLFRWRRRYRKAADTGTGFVPVVVETREVASEAAASAVVARPARRPLSPPSRPTSRDTRCA